jgi:hypothetical protein
LLLKFRRKARGVEFYINFAMETVKNFQNKVPLLTDVPVPSGDLCVSIVCASRLPASPGRNKL